AHRGGPRAPRQRVRRPAAAPDQPGLPGTRVEGDALRRRRDQRADDGGDGTGRAPRRGPAVAQVGVPDAHFRVIAAGAGPAAGPRSAPVRQSGVAAGRGVAGRVVVGRVVVGAVVGAGLLLAAFVTGCQASTRTNWVSAPAATPGVSAAPGPP